MHVLFEKLNDDLEIGICAIRLYRTKNKEIFTSEKSAYEYLYNQSKTTTKPIFKTQENPHNE